MIRSLASITAFILVACSGTTPPFVTPGPSLVVAPDGGVSLATDAPPGPCETGCARARTLKCSDVTANCEVVCERAYANHMTIWAANLAGPQCWTTATDLPALRACIGGAFQCP